MKFKGQRKPGTLRLTRERNGNHRSGPVIENVLSKIKTERCPACSAPVLDSNPPNGSRPLIFGPFRQILGQPFFRERFFERGIKFGALLS